MPELPRADLDHVVEHTRHIWPGLRGASLFVTGVSGFVGSWMLETLLHAQRVLNLGVRITALVRDRDAFVERFPHLAGAPALKLEVGDVRSMDLTPCGPERFTHFVHCASAATPQENARNPDGVVDLINTGSRRMIEIAERTGGVRFLQMSSGSVYGAHPGKVAPIPEVHTREADRSIPAERFGAAKLDAERRGAMASAKGVHFVAVRGFALIGPRLPLDGQFAIGNFLGDALAGRAVEVRGDGTPVRSWMHAADLSAWCWTMLARGRAGASYNAGSDQAITLGEAADQVASLARPPVPVVRGRKPAEGAPVSHFVPDVTRARTELDLEVWIAFDDALRRTWEWLRQ